MRRVGKSSLLLNSIAQLREQIPTRQIIYINFEDERLTLTADSLDALLQAYRELYPNIDLSHCYFFFDEIQEIDGWEKFVRRLDETISKHIVITGSNAKLLSSDIATALRGRSIRYELFPLSFPEYLAFRDIAIDPISSQGRAEMLSAFHQYVQTGGFPELAFIEDKDIHTKIIQEYYDVMIFRDIVERYQESNFNRTLVLLKAWVAPFRSVKFITKWNH